jgi:hypothetical protein
MQTMTPFRLFIAFFCFLFFFSACKKTESDANSAGARLEIFGLKTFQWQKNNVCAVDPASVELEKEPLVGNDDIISYNRSDFMFELKAPASQKVKNFGARAPFAVTVDGEIIYIGVHMPPILSSVCFESITLQHWIPNKVELRLGYPGALESKLIDDRRNDASILATLKKQGKLKS